MSMEVNRGGKVMQVKVNLQERTDAAMAMFDPVAACSEPNLCR